MRILETALPGVKIIEPRLLEDDRGAFMESYHAERFEQAGIPCAFVQDNHSISRRGVLRGLHYQLRSPQAKLCRVVVGEVYDVAVDIRRGSPSFGRWVGVTLSAENRRQLYVPRGFAHGFLALSETVEFLYKCDGLYRHGDEYGIAWDDQALGIDWPDAGPPLLSEKDRALPRLRDAHPETLPLYAAPAAGAFELLRETVHA
jgi:dTDP-4-dehydrorhamnose 3,5-epimerase